MKDMPVPAALLLLGLAIMLVVQLVRLALQPSAIQKIARRLASEGEGDYVAEVALSWFFGRGSVLYRRRFRTEAAAVSAPRSATLYCSTDGCRSTTTTRTGRAAASSTSTSTVSSGAHDW